MMPKETIAKKGNAERGYTLVELAVTIAILGLVSGFAIIRMDGLLESRDASAIQAAQAALQQVISQGSTRMDVAPAALDPDIVRDATQDYLMQNSGVTAVNFSTSGTNRYTLNLSSSTRSAQYQVQNDGQVDIISAPGFNHYSIQSGKLEKL